MRACNRGARSRGVGSDRLWIRRRDASQYQPPTRQRELPYLRSRGLDPRARNSRRTHPLRNAYRPGQPRTHPARNGRGLIGLQCARGSGLLQARSRASSPRREAAQTPERDHRDRRLAQQVGRRLPVVPSRSLPRRRHWHGTSRSSGGSTPSFPTTQRMTPTAQGRLGGHSRALAHPRCAWTRWSGRWSDQGSGFRQRYLRPAQPTAVSTSETTPAPQWQRANATTVRMSQKPVNVRKYDDTRRTRRILAHRCSSDSFPRWCAAGRCVLLRADSR